MRAVELSYGDTPPSLNRAGTRGSHWIVTREKKRWQEILAQLLLAEGLSWRPSQRWRGERVRQHWRCERVRARASLRFPTRRRRDAGNYDWLLSKSLGDALVQLGVIPDDVPEHYHFEGLHFAGEPGPPLTIVVLECEPKSPRPGGHESRPGRKQ